ncbi:hypothetical protein [Peredibacter starrii]|uniref:Lipoprotein n=1 Tax=Peredibacter starrii TaxID=28202 RepID=A0AAX4HN56_9BACT|nr:hypothetical protein [Peredibacter starrii]WPU64578.1 hypothetical protein SOO65_17940 [Peredibacter starrii]
MTKFYFIVLALFLVGCASERPKFKKEKTCSHVSLKYLKNPRNQFMQIINSPDLNMKLASTQKSMQLCYEDFKNRTGQDEFNTCMVVGVDYFGNLDFYEFSSKEVKLDQTFMKCAMAVTGQVQYADYGRNYILVQSYQFYKD